MALSAISEALKFALPALLCIFAGWGQTGGNKLHRPLAGIQPARPKTRYMITYLNGKIALKDPAYAVIDVGGVGYQVRISLTTYRLLPEAGQSTLLHTWLHIKEDGHTLFGFAEPAERTLFLHLVSVSGVGPGTALLCLSSLTVAELEQAILRENARTISGIKGIGPKTAQRLILELKDKIKKGGSGGEISSLSGPVQGNTALSEALSALVMLGLNRAAAEKTLDGIVKREGTGLTVEELIKRALKPA